MQNFTNIAQIETYVIEALGTYADEHDVEAIAEQVAIRASKTAYRIDDENFWAIVEANAIAA